MIILRGRKRFFYKDSLVVFTHKFVNLRRKALLVKGRPSFLNTQSFGYGTAPDIAVPENLVCMAGA
jgi:hypothetical protein